MSEPASNIQAVCEEHAPRPDPRFRDIPPGWFIGSFVKVGIPARNPITGKMLREHVWAKVKTTDQGRLHCIINNDFVYETPMKNGDAITVGLDEIEDAFPLAASSNCILAPPAELCEVGSCRESPFKTAIITMRLSIGDVTKKVAVCQKHANSLRVGYHGSYSITWESKH